MPLLLLSNLNPPTAGLQVGFLNISRRDEKGAGVNDVPVARQSRDPARPQAGRAPMSLPNSKEMFFQTSLFFFPTLFIERKQKPPFCH